jgi:lipopolysaccharide transport system ATP-binding protein
LTGRENTFLSGAILGMSKAEIERKFAEIVAFAELEKFIDTPVKHYSSGMYVRLAFAVAAHLEPEILLVDEVLAVGDINFQKKCLGRMGDVARAGRTVVLVSHQLNQIRRLCQRVVWVDAGQIRQDGAAHEVISAYEFAMARGGRNGEQERRNANAKGHFVKWEIFDPPVDPHALSTLGHVAIKFVLELRQQLELGHHGIALFNADGQLIWGNAKDALNLRPGLHDLCYSFPYLPLRPGAYSWRVSLYDGGELVDAWDCLPEMIVATEPVGHPRDEWAGLVNVPMELNVTSKET